MNVSSILLEWFLPETSRLPEQRERSLVAARVLRMLGFTGPRGFLVGAFLFVPSVLIARELSGLLRVGYGWLVPFWAVYAAACICVQVLMAVAVRRSVRRRVRKELSERGLPVCAACGYDLTGNVSGTCPECGQPSKHSLVKQSGDGKCSANRIRVDNSHIRENS
jgi:hypothetical protein